jgi:hypothetical protein
MTVIAWHGPTRTLAADKMFDCDGYPATTIKIHKAPNGALIGGAGVADVLNELFDWYMKGADEKEYPQSARNCDRGSRMMVVTPDASIRLYFRVPTPSIIYDPFFAIGSGADFAIAAMHLGKNAIEGVELAIQLDNSCGNGIDVLQLEAPKT